VHFSLNSRKLLSINDLRGAGAPKSLTVKDLHHSGFGHKKTPPFREGARGIFAIDAFLICKVDRATYYAYACGPSGCQTQIESLLRGLA